jgi:perosamine synthetase
MTFSNTKKIYKKILIVISKITKKNSVIHEPIFFGNELKYLKKTLDTTFVSTISPFVEKLEKQFCKYTGSKYAVALNSGTSALHLALLLSGVKKNDEVLLPSLNYIASSNAILLINAKPHFVDVENSTLGIDVKKLKKYLLKNTFQRNNHCINKKTKNIIKAIIPMHVFGHPSDLSGILTLAKKFNLTVIEDAAEGVGSFYKKKHVGTFGNIGILSFNGNKTITTGGGGMLLTKNKYIAKLAKHISTNSKIIKNFQIDHNMIGYNYRMPGINAAIGCAQLENIEKIVNAKRKIFKIYDKEFKKIDGINLLKEPKKCRSNYWLQTIILNDKLKKNRNKIINFCNKNKIKVRPVWQLMHKIKYLSKYSKMNLSNTENLEKKIINIPSSPNIIINLKKK